MECLHAKFPISYLLLLFTFNIKMIKSAVRFLEFLIVCEVFVLFYSMKINSLKKGKINKALDGISKTIYFIGHFLWLFLLLII